VIFNINVQKYSNYKTNGAEKMTSCGGNEDTIVADTKTW